jgi:hypothetical protein
MGASGSASIFDPNDGEDEGATTTTHVEQTKHEEEERAESQQRKSDNRRKQKSQTTSSVPSSYTYTEMSRNHTRNHQYTLQQLPIEVDYSPAEIARWCPTYRKCFTARALINSNSYGCICFGAIDRAICDGASAVSILDFPMILDQSVIYTAPSKAQFKFVGNKFYVIPNASVQLVCSTTAGIMDRPGGQRDIAIACTKLDGVVQTTAPLSEMLSGVFSNYGSSLKFIQTAREWLVHDRPDWFQQ